MAELQAHAGSQFDPRAVGALARVIGEPRELQPARLASAEAEARVIPPGTAPVAELAS
jgi:HD-GYP domain-containing protein (c-di-GMP phosphodiesterase class II)